MSERCEEIGPLLAAWMYEEVDAEEAAAVEEHLAECAGCRERRDAYLVVRADLQEWQPADTPRTITFIGTPVAARRQPGWLSWTARAAAVAASFVLGLGLTAAAVNLQVQHDGDGWTLSTGLFGPPAVAGTGTTGSPTVTADTEAGNDKSPDSTPATSDTTGATETAGGTAGAPAESSRPGAPAGAGQGARFAGTSPVESGAAGPRPVSLDPAQRQVLASWLDQELSERGLEALPTEPAESDLSEAERRQILNLVSDVWSRQEDDIRMYLNDLVSAMESRQREQMATTLTSIYEDLEAERRDAIFMLASQLGLIEVNHGEELARTNAKLDYLLSQMTVPPAEGQRREENR